MTVPVVSSSSSSSLSSSSLSSLSLSSLSLSSTRTRVAGVFALALACAPVLALPGCFPHRPDGVDVSTLTHDSVAARLRASAARRTTLAGTLKARLPGLEGVVVNATVDVAARVVGDLNVGVRSFFEVPQQVLVSRTVDGQSEITLYDASSGAPAFFRGPANERTLQRVLGVPLLPDDAVSLLLGRPPLDVRPGWPAARVRLLSVDEGAGTYQASIERAGRGAIVVDVDARDDRLLRAVVHRGDGRKLVTVTFAQHRAANANANASDVDVDANDDHADAAHGDLVYPRELRLVVEESGQEVVLDVNDAVYGGAIADDAFVLAPPEGVTLNPL